MTLQNVYCILYTEYSILIKLWVVKGCFSRQKYHYLVEFSKTLGVFLWGNCRDSQSICPRAKNLDFFRVLADASIGTIIVEHKDRGTRFGWNYLTTLLEVQGRRIEAVFPDETQDDLVSDFVSIITRMAARIYGRRGSRRKAERIKQCVEEVMKQEV